MRAGRLSPSIRRSIHRVVRQRDARLRQPPQLEQDRSPDALLSHCRNGLKGFKRPSAAALVDILPSTGIGKIAKNLLRDQIVRGEIALVRAE